MSSAENFTRSAGVTVDLDQTIPLGADGINSDQTACDVQMLRLITIYHILLV